MYTFPHVEYSLSDSGKELYPVFYEMALWSSRYL
ncbi:MAG: winged helix-turn-helix transcriptional regulator [Lachnospiraceae bacterium]